MDRQELMTGVIDYLELLTEIATSFDKDAALIKKISDASSEAEREGIRLKFSKVPPPSTMPEKSALIASILVLQKWLRELGVSFSDPSEAVVAYFKEKGAGDKLYPS